MSSDEEFLDDFLKSVMEGEEESDYLSSEKEVEVESDMENEEDSLMTDYTTEDLAVEDFAIEDFGVIEPEPGEFMDEEEMEDDNSDSLMSSDEIDAILAAAADAAVGKVQEEPDLSLKPAFEAEPEFLLGEEEAEADSTVDDDLAEISGLLNSDGGEIDDDMIALLESMSSEPEESRASVDALGVAAALGNTGSDGEDIPEEVVKTEKKGLFSKLFKGKKKKEEQGEKEDLEETEQMQRNGESEEAESQEETFVSDVDWDKISGDENAEAGIAEGVPAPKKRGFFTKIMAFLTEADDDENSELNGEHGMQPSDENRDILEALDEEDKKKKKKKVKGKKEQKEEASEDEDGEEIEEVKKSKKKKKEKLPKVDSIELMESTKPGKKISKKNIAIIAGLCLTLTAVVVVLCSVVPEFFDKRKARDAYYEADYSESYKLLYGKKLDNSDTLIYNKSRIILELNRKLESYHNYMGIGKRVEALDALMAGVQKYAELSAEAEEYHVTNEVNAVYETILNILSDKYNLSEPVAKVIIDYDDLTYTRKLESIVYGTPFIRPETVAESTEMEIQEVIPEEQALLEESAPEETVVPEEAAAVNEAEEELPVDDAQQSEALSTQESDNGAVETSDSAENSEQETTADIAEENTEAAAQNSSSVNNSGSSNSQGELIQGVRQPIDIQIHGN